MAGFWKMLSGLNHRLRGKNSLNISSDVQKMQAVDKSRGSRFAWCHNIGRTMTIYATLFASADVVSQKLVHQRPTVNWRSVRNSAVYGGGPNACMVHLWLSTLNWIFPKASPLNVIRMVALDQLMFTPVYLVAFFMGTNALESQSWTRGWQVCRQQFFPTWAKSLAVWPLVQAANFTFCSPCHRPIVVSVFNFAWTILLMSTVSQSSQTAAVANGLAV